MLIAFQIKIYRCSKYIGFELITENKTTFILPCPVKLSTLLKPTPMIELMQKATVEKKSYEIFSLFTSKKNLVSFLFFDRLTHFQCLTGYYVQLLRSKFERRVQS